MGHIIVDGSGERYPDRSAGSPFLTQRCGAMRPILPPSYYPFPVFTWVSLKESNPLPLHKKYIFQPHRPRAQDLDVSKGTNQVYVSLETLGMQP